MQIAQVGRKFTKASDLNQFDTNRILKMFQSLQTRWRGWKPFKEKFHKNTLLIQLLHEMFRQEQGRSCDGGLPFNLNLTWRSFVQTDLMTKAELAFCALDRDDKGYITRKDFKKLTTKITKEELMELMQKVIFAPSN